MTSKRKLLKDSYTLEYSIITQNDDCKERRSDKCCKKTEHMKENK